MSVVVTIVKDSSIYEARVEGACIKPGLKREGALIAK